MKQGLTIAFAAALASTSAAFTYQYDDGTANVNIGPPSSFAQFPNTDFMWGKFFEVQNGQNQITSVEVGFGSFSVEPREVEILVYETGSSDFDPFTFSGGPLFSTVINATSDTLDTRTTITLPTPVEVDTGFFVAALIRDADPGNEAAARLDTDGSGENSWLVYFPEADTSDIGGSLGFAAEGNNSGVFIFPGNFVIRANAVPSPGAAGLIVIGAVAAGRRRR